MLFAAEDFEAFESGVVYGFSISGFWVLVFNQDEIVALWRLITLVSSNQRCLFARHRLHLDIFWPLTRLTKINFAEHLVKCL